MVMIPSIINVTSWDVNTEYGDIFPEGKREKKLLIAPNDEQVIAKGIKPGWRYLFKESREKFPHHYWSEIVSYYLGVLMGIPITDTYIAVKNNTAGALISWFYTPNDIYTSGGQYMVKMINGYNLNKGTQHNWGTVSQVVGIPIHTIWAEHWAKIFCFDTLRGERDRHQDNWGLIRPKNTELDDWTSYRFSPAFDNGTSLGYELDENRILKTSMNIDAYILNKKAQHHMKWNLEDSRTYNHMEFMINFIRHYPEFKSIIEQSLNFDFDQFTNIVNKLTTLSVPCILSKLRAEFMIELILSRVLKLKEMLKREFD